MSTIDIRRLDFTLLAVFHEVLRTGRTTLAAERLGLSQSAVSHALGRLRSVFGDPLFLRRANGLEPTEAALALGPRIAAILAMTEEALAGGSAFAPAASDRVFRIAANDFVASLLAPALRARLAAEAPAAGFSVRFAVGAAAIEAVRRGDVDLAVGRFRSLPDDIEPTRLGAEDYLVAARQGHPGVGRALDLDTYLRLDHVLVSFRGDFRGTADLALARLGVERRVKVAAPMFLTAFALAQASDLLVTAPARLVRAFAPSFGLAAHAPPFAIPPFEVQLLSARRKAATPGLHWLRDRVREAWNAGAQASNSAA